MTRARLIACPVAIAIACAAPAVTLAAAGATRARAGEQRAGAAASVRVLVGRTSEHERIALTIAGRHVRRVALTVRRYRCERFGDIGPLRIVRRPGSPLGRRGHVVVVAGPAAERLELHARLRHGHRLRGHFRLRGTIALGERCRSRRVRFSAHRARPRRTHRRPRQSDRPRPERRSQPDARARRGPRAHPRSRPSPGG